MDSDLGEGKIGFCLLRVVAFCLLPKLSVVTQLHSPGPPDAVHLPNSFETILSLCGAVARVACGILSHCTTDW